MFLGGGGGHTIGGSIGQQEIRQQAFLDGGITTQGLLV